MDESFLIVGGSGSGMDLDTIYKYQKDNDSFALLDARLPSPVANPIAMMVDVDIFPSCQ